MKTLHVVAVCTAFTVSVAAFADFAPVDYVLPEMGTDSTGDFSTGNTYPAIARPWGMNFWSPVTTERNGDGWMYGWRDNKFRGIRQTHQLSPWVNDYGSFLVMPVVGKVAFTNKDRGTRFTHKAETFKPYHYGVYLGEYDVKFEVTPTERAAMMRVTYPETDAAYLVIDAGPGRCGVRMEGASRAVGWNAKNHGSVGKGFRNTFALEFSEPVVEAKAWLRESLVDGDCVECEGREKGTCGLLLKFAPKKRGDVVTVRVASTFLGEDQLARNFRELGARSFDEIAAEGRKAWNDVLGRMKVESEDFNRKQVFYTCLYRAALWPHKLYELDGRGRPVHANFNGGEPGPKPGCLYGDTVFWDTFRALFPLMNFFAPEQAGEATEGWECVWKEAGWLPEGMSPGLFACMIGNNSASIVADACISGVPGRYDKMELFRAMVHGAENSHIIHTIGRGGAKDYIACGYLPYDNEQKVGDSAARTLEYARKGEGRHVARELRQVPLGRRLHGGQSDTLVVVGVPRRRRAHRGDGRPQGVQREARVGDDFRARRASRQLRRDDPRDARNAVHAAGAVRARQPAHPAHALSLELERRAVAQPILGTRGDGPSLPAARRRVLRGRRHRPDVRLVRMGRAWILSGLPRHGRVRDRLADLRSRDSGAARRQKARRRGEGRFARTALHRQGDVRRKTCRRQLS